MESILENINTTNHSWKTDKFVGSNEVYAGVLKQLGNGAAKLLSIVFEDMSIR